MLLPVLGQVAVLFELRVALLLAASLVLVVASLFAFLPLPRLFGRRRLLHEASVQEHAGAAEDEQGDTSTSNCAGVAGMRY
tara:strand:+ start:1183 stop:1425 length:243 start_codon:yes stop_codon:yes gene_type:complete